MMQTLALLLLQAAYVFGCGTPAVKPDTNRVVNGEDARPHSWPWQISLQVKHGSRFHHTCGGTLVGPRWVLTAGHCIWPGDVYRVVLGEHSMSLQEGTEQIRDVLRIVVHPKWDIDFVADGNDLALLKLDKSPIMSDSVSVACLPEAGEIPAHGTPCYISGWGNLYILLLPPPNPKMGGYVDHRWSRGGLNEAWVLKQTIAHGPMPDKLQQALLPVVEHSVCSRSDWWGINAKSTMICAGGDIVSGCNGDSGGPLNCLGQDGRWYVQGVTSFVSSRVCNEVKKPTVFTRTSAFTDWLSEVMLKY